MKKTIFKSFGVLLITMVSYNISFAKNEQCLIEYAPAPILINYIDNLKMIQSRIEPLASELKSASKGQSRMSSLYDKSIAIINSTLSWDDYGTQGEFYISYGMTNEYIPRIWRDYSLLEKEREGLNKYINALITKGAPNEKIDTKKLCNGIPSCNFESEKLHDILSEILKNNKNIELYFKLSILGKTGNFKEKLMFTPDNFKSEFNKYYNQYTTQDCSDYQDETDGLINKIKKKFEEAHLGYRSWEEAIDLLRGTTDDRQMAIKERELLTRELRNQGINTNASENIIKNLDEYNKQGGFSFRNNFITNSIDYVKNMVTSQIDGFRDASLKTLEDAKERGNTDGGIISNEGFTLIKGEFDIEKLIELNLKDMYQRELPQAQEQDINTTNLEGRLINIHESLSISIENLDNLIKPAKKICNDQGSGAGICE